VGTRYTESNLHPTYGFYSYEEAYPGLESPAGRRSTGILPVSITARMAVLQFSRMLLGEGHRSFSKFGS
jgi:hypothetical protein